MDRIRRNTAGTAEKCRRQACRTKRLSVIRKTVIQGRNMDIVSILAVIAVAVMAIIIRIAEDKEE